MRPEQLDGRVLGHERAARVDHRPEPARSRFDLGGHIGRRTRAALPPPREPREQSRPRPPGDRAQAGIVRPDHVGIEVLDALGQERLALPSRHGRDVGTTGLLRAADRERTSEQVEVEAGVRPESRQQPLPETQYAVDLFGRPPVGHGGPDPGRRHQFARSGQAGVAIIEPAPVGQFLGQGARRPVGPEFLTGPHREPVRMWRCQGSAAHLPGSNRAG